jgi:ATP synthase F1 complex assembly factor 2
MRGGIRRAGAGAGAGSVLAAASPSSLSYFFGRQGAGAATARSFSAAAPPPQTHQRIKGRSRFYKHVGVKRSSDGEAWQVLLDSRVLKTPARNPLHLPSQELALAVAMEWDFQTSQKGIEPTLMPLMTLSSTAIDQISPAAELTVQSVMNYLRTDTTCFPVSPSEDAKLRERQDRLWTPIRQALEEEMGIVLHVSDGGLARPEHPAATVRRIQALLESLPSLELAAVQCITMDCKSLVIALALAHRLITVQEAFAAARVEEQFNIDEWGLVEGGHDFDITHSELQLTAASSLLWLGRGSANQLRLRGGDRQTECGL